MYTLKRKNDFMQSEAGIEAYNNLKLMVADDTYHTKPSFSTNKELYPDGLIPFIEKHIDYLCAHSETNPPMYLSNLRLINRIRG